MTSLSRAINITENGKHTFLVLCFCFRLITHVFPINEVKPPMKLVYGNNPTKNHDVT